MPKILNYLLIRLGTTLLVLAGSIIILVIGAVPVTAGESPATGIPGDAGTAVDVDAYLAQLRTELPQSWLQREYQRQRSFPAFVRSRQLVAKGQYEEALQELDAYLASDPDDVVIQFGYLVLAMDLKRYRAAIGAADRILALVPDFGPALFYRGLARAAVGENKEAMQDLAAAVGSKTLAPADTQYARRSLAMAAVANPATAEALALLESEEAKAGADSTLLVAKGQLLERLGRAREAEAAYDEAVNRSENNDEKRTAWVFGAELALTNGDSSGALSRAEAAWKVTPGNPEVATVLVEAASRLGRTDLVESVERGTKTENTADRGIRESLANALFRVGRYDQAAAKFEELAQTASSPAEKYRLRRAAGFAAQAANDLSHAFSALQSAAEINPSPEALSAAAEASLQAGHLDVAATDLARLADGTDGRDRGQALERLSVVEEQRGRIKEALAALDRVQTDGRDAGLERRSSVLAVKAGDFEAGVSHARRAAELEPTQANLRALGEAELAAGHPEAAVESFQRALKLSPGNDSSLREMLANSLVAAGRPSLAATEFETLAAAATRTADTEMGVRHLERLSFVYEMMGQPKRALEALGRLPKTEQNRPEIIRRKAVLAQSAGDRRAMLTYLRELATADPSEKNLLAVADAEIGAGQGNAAAATLETLLANRGLPAQNRASYLERLGNIEISRGNAKRAQSLFAEAYHLSPAHPPEWLAHAAESAIQDKDWQSAAQWYRILAENERIPRKTRAGYEIRLGSVLANLGRDQDALAAYNAAVELGGANPDLYKTRGSLLMHLGRASAAASDFHAAYNALPRADLALLLGYAYQAARQPGVAIVFLRRALADPRALSPAQKEQASAALGYAYSETEQHGKAAGCFEKALGISPSSTASRSCALANETAAIQ